jgi:hypothetical protein
VVLIVQLLLKKGEDVNTELGLYENALQLALSEGHDSAAAGK